MYTDRENFKSLTNPAAFFAEWKSKEKAFKYYHKFATPNEKGEKGENRYLKLPFSFIFLAQFATIKGFVKKENASYRANEVINTKTDPMKVYLGKQFVIEGLYGNIKPLLNKAANFTWSVYGAMKGKDGYKIVNFQLSGTARSEWIEFCNDSKSDIFKKAVTISGYIEDNTGDIDYFKPVFELTHCSDADNEAAKELAKELRSYMNQYFNKPPEEVIEVEEEEEVEDTPPPTDEPIENEDNFPSAQELNADLPF